MVFFPTWLPCHALQPYTYTQKHIGSKTPLGLYKNKHIIKVGVLWDELLGWQSKHIVFFNSVTSLHQLTGVKRTAISTVEPIIWANWVHKRSSIAAIRWQSSSMPENVRKLFSPKVRPIQSTLSPIHFQQSILLKVMKLSSAMTAATV